jgi:hypothetical protein
MTWLRLPFVTPLLAGLGSALGSITLAAPLIVLPPQPATVTTGQPATFSVIASGAGTLGYAWRRNGADIGATSSSLTTGPATLANSGAAYTVVVTDDSGTQETMPVYLTVNPAAPQAFAIWAAMIADPAQRSPSAAPLGDGVPNLVKYALGLAPDQRPAPADLPALVGKEAGLVFRFVRGRAATGVALIPQKSNTLEADSWSSVPVTKVADDGVSEIWESIVATGDAHAFYRLKVATHTEDPPAITAHPASVSVDPDATPTFTVETTGTGPFSYQWRRNGTSISGATSASYTPPAATAADHGARFSVLVTGPAGTVASADAVLTITEPPVINTFRPIPAAFGTHWVTVEYLNGEHTLIKDADPTSQGDLVSIGSTNFLSPPDRKAVLVVSPDHGATWNSIPVLSPELDHCNILAVEQDQTHRKLHLLMIRVDLSNNDQIFAYARGTLVHTDGHVTGLTLDTKFDFAGNFADGWEVRANFKAVRDQSGAETLLATVDGSDRGSAGNTFRITARKSLTLTPAADSDFTDLAGVPGAYTELVRYSDPRIVTHETNSISTQLAATRDIVVVWGRIDREGCRNTQVPLRAMVLQPAGPHFWATGPVIDVMTPNPTDGNEPNLLALSSSATRAYVFYGHDAEGPTIDSIDRTGAVIHNALPCPYPPGRSADPLNNGTGSLSVSPDGSRAWLIFGLLNRTWTQTVHGQCTWDGSTWTSQLDPFSENWQGESQGAWNGGVAAIRTVSLWPAPSRLWISTVRTEIKAQQP